MAGSYYTFDVSARSRGLCPHMKNHPLGGWMFIVLFVTSFSGSENKHQKYGTGTAWKLLAFKTISLYYIPK